MKLSLLLLLCYDLGFTWKPSPDPRTTGYVLVWGGASRVYNSSTNVGNVVQAHVTGIQAGKLHYFSVYAYGGNDLRSDYANEVTHLKPGAPRFRIEVVKP